MPDKIKPSAASANKLDGDVPRVNPYEKIKDAITSGELSAGQPLTESMLATWCGVSRTPVREALLRLEQDGLLAWSERGLMVRKRSPQEILDVYEMRIVLEATASRMSANRRTEHDILLMRGAQAQAVKVDPGNADEIRRFNRSFHRLFWRSAHNESLQDLLERLHMHLVGNNTTTAATPGRWEEACKEHEDLIDAVERRDEVAAAELATHHFTTARNITLSLLASEIGGS